MEDRVIFDKNSEACGRLLARSLHVRAPLRSIQLVPASPEPELTESERAVLQAAWRKRNRRRIARNFLWLVGVLVVGLTVSGAGGWLLSKVCPGLNYIWGGLIGLAMVYVITGVWTSSWEI